MFVTHLDSQTSRLANLLRRFRRFRFLRRSHLSPQLSLIKRKRRKRRKRRKGFDLRVEMDDELEEFLGGRRVWLSEASIAR